MAHQNTDATNNQLETKVLTQANILKFFLPLAISWVFMSIEGPITASIVSNSPASETALAALALMVALAIFIESPVIDLLSTATTLTKSRQNYTELRRFTILLMVWVALIQALVSCTPIYWIIVENIIGAQHDVAVALQPAMVIMIPWAACVGWRRFHQGVMIGHGATKPIGIGTVVRIATLIAVGVSLINTTTMSGIVVAAWAMVASVFAEAIFAHFACLPTMRKSLHITEQRDQTGTSLKELATFHFPLTVATMTLIATMPMATWALAHSPNSKLTLAAWGLSQGTVFLFRSVTFALPETVITLYKDATSKNALAKFCTTTGIVCTAAVVLIVITGLGHLFFSRVLGGSQEIAKLGALVLLSTMFIPFVTAKASMLRGMLTFHRLTRARLVAIAFAVASMAVVLAVGVTIKMNGIVLAGLAVTAQHLLEYAVLAYYWKKSEQDMANTPGIYQRI